MRTAADGRSVLDAFATLGASMPVTVMVGWFHSRDRIGPLPMSDTPSSTAASSRSCSSENSGTSASWLVMPSTATDPASS
jgi:hypothetical protein